MHRKISSMFSGQSQRLKDPKVSFNNKSQDFQSLSQLHMHLLRLVESKDQQMDVAKISEAIGKLLMNLEKSSQNEIELGYKQRMLQQQQQSSRTLEQKYLSLQEKYNTLETQNRFLQAKIEDMTVHNSRKDHKMQLQEKKSSELSLKVQGLEQRLEIILESDFANDQVNIRKTLTDLVKECERQKRDIQLKNQEIQRLQEQLKSAQGRISKLYQKVDTMKKKISIRELENLTFDKNEDLDNKEKQSDPTNILNRNQPCDNLDFRVNALKMEFADIINDIAEQGTHVFAQKILQLQPKQQKEQIQLVSSQYVSFKDCAEKLNTLIRHMLSLMTIQDFRDQLKYIDGNLKNVFMAQSCRLWVMDAQTGVLYTVNENAQELRMLLNKGIFAEVLRFQKPIHRRDYALLCESASSQKQQMNTNQSLCYPLFVGQQLSGVLEVSNSVSDFFSFDEEYYGVLLSKFIEAMMGTQIKARLQDVTISYNGYHQDALNSMLLSTDRVSLHQLIVQWISTILTVNQVAFYFVDDEKMSSYRTQPMHFALQGLAGLVAKRQKQLIVMNTRKATEFDETVDIDTILPVLILPLVHKEKTYAVFEVPIKNRTALKLIGCFKYCWLGSKFRDGCFVIRRDYIECNSYIKIIMMEEGEIITHKGHNCDICGKPDKYLCPACSLRTCSLQCCKFHKVQMNCSGVRSQVKAVPITDKDVQRDFNYLSEVMKTTETIQKRLSGITALPDAMRYKLLKQQARRQCVDLMLAPKIMKKHRQNISFYSVKDKQIHWCVEILYYGHSIITKPQPQKATIKDIIMSQDLFKSEILDTELINFDKDHIRGYFEHENVLLKWQTYPVVEFSEQDEYRFKNQKKRFNQQQIYSKEYYDINPESTLEEIIKGYTVFEFPTIELQIQ